MELNARSGSRDDGPAAHQTKGHDRGRAESVSVSIRHRRDREFLRCLAGSAMRPESPGNPGMRGMRPRSRCHCSASRGIDNAACAPTLSRKRFPERQLPQFDGRAVSPAQGCKQSEVERRSFEVHGIPIRECARRSVFPRGMTYAVQPIDPDGGGMDAQLHQQRGKSGGRRIDPASIVALRRVLGGDDHRTPLSRNSQRCEQADRTRTQDGHIEAAHDQGGSIAANRGSAIGSKVTRKPRLATARAAPSMPFGPIIAVLAALTSGAPAIPPRS